MTLKLRRNVKKPLRTRKRENKLIRLIRFMYRLFDNGLKLLDNLLDIE